MTTIEGNPMNRHALRTELEPQRAAVQTCRDTLADALDGLTLETSTAARAYKRKGRVAASYLDAVYTGITAVRRAEEALDLAELDLHTAAGGDV